MNEQVSQEAKPVNGSESQAAERSRRSRQKSERQVSDPREVATLVMARMAMIHSKKDELTIAIKGLSDVTQQLSVAYGQQMQSIERLTLRVKALEATATAAAEAWADRPSSA
jgi:hypothetical protein